MGNEKAINQLIAHHSIVFEPEKLLVWVSTSPRQLGKFVAYDLNKVFALSGMKQDHEICDSSLTIAADSFLLTRDYKNFIAYRKYKHDLADGKEINTDSLMASNPQFYHTYVLAGDYLYKKEKIRDALRYYRLALTKVIATKKEADYINAQIKKCNKKLPA
jgi:isopenicillin-N N-acyltransferase like protein